MHITDSSIIDIVIYFISVNFFCYHVISFVIALSVPGVLVQNFAIF